MKLRYFLSLPFLLLLMAFSCQSQNGPTKPSVSLTWTQSTTAGVTANCVYRGTAAGTYTLPAIFCSTVPITNFIDVNVARNTTQHYAVTAKVGATEGAFSNDATAVIPQAPAAPTLNTNPVITEAKLPNAPGVVPQLNAKVEWTKQ